MASLGRAWAWGKQKPPLGSQIDWGHPLAQGLDGAYLVSSLKTPNVARNLPDLVSFVTPGTDGPITAVLGESVVFQTSPTYYSSTGALPENWATTGSGRQYTLSWYGYFTAVGAGTSTSIWGAVQAPASGSSWFVIARRGDAGPDNLGFKINSSSIGNANVGLSNRYFEPMLLTLTYDNVANVSALYVNGVLVTTATAGTWTAPGTMRLGDHNAGRTANQVTAACWAWSRKLSSAEIAVQAADPYCFIKGPGH